MTSTYVEMKSNKFPAGKKRQPPRRGSPKDASVCSVWRTFLRVSGDDRNLKSYFRLADTRIRVERLMDLLWKRQTHSSHDAAGHPHLLAAIQRVFRGVYLIITFPLEDTIALVPPGRNFQSPYTSLDAALRLLSITTCLPHAFAHVTRLASLWLPLSISAA